MNYYQPRELKQSDKPTGRYHYTCQNDDRVWPVGYCAQDCIGHIDKEGAYEHYKQYLLDTNLRLNAKSPDQQRKCEVCGEWTDSFAEIPLHMWLKPLCQEHMNRESVEKLLVVGDSVSSY